MNTNAVLLPQSWIDALLAEAERDVVFAWHITQGSFGGPKLEQSEWSNLLKAAARSLIERGCNVGFGDPDAENWKPIAVAASPVSAAEQVVAHWAAEPSQFEFLAFAKREAGTSNLSLQPTAFGDG